MSITSNIYFKHLLDHILNMPQHDIDSIDKVQRRATKQIPSLKDMEYPDRLKKLKMPTLKYRRLRGDMIEAFKIITGIYDNEVTEGIFDLDPNTRIRGHSKNIKKKFCKINLRKFSFTNRIVDLWNTLPQSVIDAKDVTQFEIRLDKYWEHQDVKFEYKASIQNKENPRKPHRNKLYQGRSRGGYTCSGGEPASTDDPDLPTDQLLVGHTHKNALSPAPYHDPRRVIVFTHKITHQKLMPNG
jgi:hypothetical protein